MFTAFARIRGTACHCGRSCLNIGLSCPKATTFANTTPGKHSTSSVAGHVPFVSEDRWRRSLLFFDSDEKQNQKASKSLDYCTDRSSHCGGHRMAASCNAHRKRGPRTEQG